MRYLIKLRMSQEKRESFNNVFEKYSTKLILAIGVITIPIALGLLIGWFANVITFKMAASNFMVWFGFVGIVSFLLDGISKFLSLTWEEIEKKENVKLEIFNQFSYSFIPMLLCANVLTYGFCI